MKKVAIPSPEEGQTRPPAPPGPPLSPVVESMQRLVERIDDLRQTLNAERGFRTAAERKVAELSSGGFWTRIDTEETDSLIMTTSIHNVTAPPEPKPIDLLPGEKITAVLCSGMHSGGCLVRSFNGFKNPATSSTGIVFMEGVHWSAEAGEFVPAGGGSDG